MGLLTVLGVTVAYAYSRELRPVAGLLFGAKTAALAALAHALVTSARTDLRQWRLAAVAAGAFLAMFAFAVPVPLVLVAAAGVGAAADALAPPRQPTPAADDPLPRPAFAFARPAGRLALGLAAWAAPLAVVAVALGPQHVLVRECLFFGTAALAGFGGAPAVFAYAAQPMDGVPAWAAPGEMLEGLGLALAVPGPSIQWVLFLGFLGAWRGAAPWPPLLAGVAGAAIATWATGGPGLLLRATARPQGSAPREHPRVEAVRSSARAGLWGVGMGLTLWLTAHLLFAGVRAVQGPWGARGIVPRWWSLDLSALALTAVAYAALARWRWSRRVTLLGCAAVGLLLRWALGVL